MAAPISFASVTNLQHLEDMYAKWQADPASVDRDWQTFFAGFDLGFARPAPGADDSAADSKSAGQAPGRI
ncbi:MAG TPA: hypothetical protein VHX44_02425, partial [Planctomycetota bacterium]|nr:hypothetical protein [Planctomycetota bacterium]